MKKNIGNSWKNAQSRIKKKEKNKLAFLVLGVVLATLFAGNSLRFINTLTKPFYSSFDKNSYSWDGQYNLNLVFKGEESISLLVVNPSEKKVLNLSIPSNVLIEVPGGFGSWEVRSIFDLEKENPKKGAKLLKDSISIFFGLPIDGLIQAEEGISSVEFLSELNKNPFSVLSLINKIKTDLTIVELLRFDALIFQTRADKIENTNLLLSDLLDNSKLADDSDVYSAGERLDLFVLDKLSDPNIRNEQKTIAVLNGTDYPGLAQKFSRVISNMGGNVVISDNTEYKIKYTQVVGEESKTVSRLKQIFTSKYAKLEEQMAFVANGSASRAQVIVILGEDIASR